MKLITALTVWLSLLVAQTERPAAQSVTAIRHWSLADVTRVVIEVSGEFNFVTDRLHNPERVYFDILNSKPRLDARLRTEQIEDKRLKRIRVAETLPGVTRVVLDLAGPVEATPTQLKNPSRLIVELRTGLPAGETVKHTDSPAGGDKQDAPKSEPPKTAPAKNVPAKPEAIRPQPSLPEPPKVGAPPLPSVSASILAVEAPVQPVRENPGISQPAPNLPAPAQPMKSDAESPRPGLTQGDGAEIAVSSPEKSRPADGAVTESATALSASAAALSIGSASEPSAPAATPVPFPPSEVSKAARHTASGETSLVRALGLKMGRVVIDPGHGGHDQGTQGARGLQEKELVLDVAKRVGKLIEDHMNAEVIYTRKDDTFIPLEGRTALANEKKADLFLSIHANSSPVKSIAGVETYYLNFADSQDALDVAARENASSQKTIFELRDIIQKITLHDKAEESKEFAGRIQASLYAFSTRNFPGAKNRGVKKAPFVVLIGANMPSILAEIGFLSNPREEALLKKPEYRQRLAEALFRGVSRYADSLSHFQVARAK